MRHLRLGLLACLSVGMALLALGVTAGPGWGQGVYRIEGIANEVPGPLVFVRVSFWNTKVDMDAAKSPECVNDFRMMLPAKGLTPIYDASGKAKTKSGKWVGTNEWGAWLTGPDDPVVYVEFTRDMVKGIHHNITQWWLRDYQRKRLGPAPLPPDGRDSRIKVTHVAATGAVTKPDVMALVGKVFEVSK